MPRQCGQLIDDGIRANARNRGSDRCRIERITDQSLGAHLSQDMRRLRRFRRTRQAKHTVPVLFQTADQWASNSSSRARQQNSHLEPPG
jgi:hypothetical protein